MEQFFILLYPTVTAISVAAYLPQIKALISSREPLKDISLSSWMMWCLSTFLAFGYTATHIHDTMLVITTGCSFGLVVLTTGLIAYNRYIRFANTRLLRPARKTLVPAGDRSWPDTF